MANSKFVISIINNLTKLYNHKSFCIGNDAIDFCSRNSDSSGSLFHFPQEIRLEYP